MKRSIRAATLVGALLAAACGGSPSAPTAPSSTQPSGGNGGTSGTSSVTGTWLGSVSDSSGSMMGAGMSSAMMSNMTWNIAQNGSSFTGTMQVPGWQGGQMMISGTINGTTGTFTMTIPAGAMMSMMFNCSAVATGTFDLDAMYDLMKGIYSGSNTCFGPFGNGQVNLTRH